MEFRDFGHATTIPICNWIFETFLVDGKFKGLSNTMMLACEPKDASPRAVSGNV
jgi:hypothetical protein